MLAWPILAAILLNFHIFIYFIFLLGGGPKMNIFGGMPDIFGCKQQILDPSLRDKKK